METNPVHRAETEAAISRSQYSGSLLFPGTTWVWLGAALLISIGVAFELGLFGFGPYNSSDAWLFFSIGKNVWIMITNLIGPELRELLNVWPLMLVSLGLAILLLTRIRNELEPTTANSLLRKENHADRH